jgi:hypothetical protein
MRYSATTVSPPTSVLPRGPRGSNPVRCCFSVRRHSRGRPVTCDPYWPDRDRSCPPGTSGSWCRADPARTMVSTEWQAADQKSRRRSLGTRDTACPDSPARIASDAGGVCSGPSGGCRGGWTWPAPSGGAILSALTLCFRQEVVTRTTTQTGAKHSKLLPRRQGDVAPRAWTARPASPSTVADRCLGSAEGTDAAQAPRPWRQLDCRVTRMLREQLPHR